MIDCIKRSRLSICGSAADRYAAISNAVLVAFYITVIGGCKTDSSTAVSDVSISIPELRCEMSWQCSDNANYRGRVHHGPVTYRAGDPQESCLRDVTQKAKEQGSKVCKQEVVTSPLAIKQDDAKMNLYTCDDGFGFRICEALSGINFELQEKLTDLDVKDNKVNNLRWYINGLYNNSAKRGQANQKYYGHGADLGAWANTVTKTMCEHYGKNGTFNHPDLSLITEIYNVKNWLEYIQDKVYQAPDFVPYRCEALKFVNPKTTAFCKKLNVDECRDQSKCVYDRSKGCIASGI